jgi:hypothetical protein
VGKEKHMSIFDLRTMVEQAVPAWTLLILVGVAVALGLWIKRKGG